MALNKNHQAHIDMTNAFAMADKNTPRDSLGGASYGMGARGMPRTPAQQASVKKAAQKSAISRGARAGTDPLARSPAAPTTKGPAALQPPAGLVKAPGVSTGSLSIAKPKKGLLSL